MDGNSASAFTPFCDGPQAGAGCAEKWTVGEMNRRASKMSQKKNGVRTSRPIIGRGCERRALAKGEMFQRTVPRLFWNDDDRRAIFETEEKHPGQAAL